MAITVRSSTSAVGTNTSIVVDKPSGVQDGDVLVASQIGTDNTFFNLTTGWTVALNFGYAGGIDDVTSQHYRIITDASSEPSTYTFTWLGPEKRAVHLLCLAGVLTSDPINQNSCRLGHGTTENNLRPDEHTTTEDGCLSVMTGCIVGQAIMTTGGFTAPSPWTIAENSSAGGTTYNYSGCTGYRTVDTAQTVAAHTWNSTVTGGFSDSAIIISYNADPNYTGGGGDAGPSQTSNRIIVVA